jgi:PAS domain S-box-containing protein
MFGNARGDPPLDRAERVSLPGTESNRARLGTRKAKEAPASLHVLQVSDARWQAVLRSSPDAIVGIDSSGRITLFNPTAERMFGHTAASVLGRDVAMLMPTPYAEQHDGYIRRYQATGEARAIGQVRHVQATRRDGEVFPIELSVSEANVEGAVFYMAIIRDVSERFRARSQLEARARQQGAVAWLGQLALGSNDPTALMNAAAELVARTLELKYVRVLELLPDGATLLLRAGAGGRENDVGRATLSATSDSPAGRALGAKGPVVTEDFRLEAGFADSAWLGAHGVISGMNVPIEGGEQAFGVLGAYADERRDFSDADVSFLQSVANVLAEALARRRAEAELAELAKHSRQRERLADIGAITAKLVHDLGNPLAAVSMQAQLILRRSRRGDVQPPGLVEQPAERVLSTVRRLESLVREFNSFARDQRLSLTNVDLPDFLATILDLWGPLAAGRRIDLRLVDARQGITLRADEEKLRRVFDNLIANALEAIDRGPGEVVLRVAIPSREKVRISIEDTGPGIPEDVDVFRLFETTKAEGTGIGLAVARQIVLAHGGAIEHAMREPHGAVFHVDLPRRGPAARV